MTVSVGFCRTAVDDTALPCSVATRPASKMDVFTPEEDERFIHLVSQNPILYDSKHVDFKELHLKDNIWKDISKELNKKGEFSV